METIKQNDILILDIIDYGINGEGVAKHGGIVVFVPFAIKGECIKAKITYVKRAYATAELVEVLSESHFRQKPVCNRFIRCGGCNLLHLAYEEQLRLKKEILNTTLKKNIGGEFTISDCIPSKKVLGSRNKVQLPFGVVNGKPALGFFRENTHKIVSVTKCFLHEDWLEKLIAVTLEFVNTNGISVYDETTGKGLLRHLVARHIDKQLCLVLVANGRHLPKSEIYIGMLGKEFGDFSLYLSVNTKDTNVILGDELLPLVEKPFVINILGLSAQLNPLSFLQVNDEIRDEIYRAVIEKTSSSDIVIDAFSGVGIIGAVLAKNGVKNVYNIEIVPEAIADANALAAQNGIADSVINICGDAAVELPKLLKYIKESSPAAQKVSIILDPPRKGVASAVIEALNGIDHPVELIYVSCNPATLSRDLALLTKNNNYVINSITPYDMFPNTRHLETLVCMTRR